MHKKILIMILNFIPLLPIYAATCPSIKAIHRHALQGWQFYDSDDNTILSFVQAARFEKQVKQFALAEWSAENNKQDMMHCYYTDNNGSHLNAYLAKAHYAPQNTPGFWYPVTGSLHCAAGMDKCHFRDLMNQQTLAKK